MSCLNKLFLDLLFFTWLGGSDAGWGGWSCGMCVWLVTDEWNEYMERSYRNTMHDSKRETNVRLHWTFSAATLQILFMLKQQHYTLTNVKKVKSQSTTPLRVSKSWGNFHFWVNYPFKLWPFSYYQLQAHIYVHVWIHACIQSRTDEQNKLKPTLFFFHLDACHKKEMIWSLLTSWP